MSDLSSAYPQLPQLAETALVVSRDLSKSVYLNSVSCCKLPMNIEHEIACYRRCCFHCVTVAEQDARFRRLHLLQDIEVKFFFRFSETPKPIYILARLSLRIRKLASKHHESGQLSRVVALWPCTSLMCSSQLLVRRCTLLGVVTVSRTHLVGLMSPGKQAKGRTSWRRTLCDRPTCAHAGRMQVQQRFRSTLSTTAVTAC